MDLIDKAQRAKRRQTIKLKDNLLHQLLAHQCPVRVDTLKQGAQLAGLCDIYSHLDDAVNELIREKKIVLNFIGDGEIYFSTTPSAVSHFSAPKHSNDYGIPPFRRL